MQGLLAGPQSPSRGISHGGGRGAIGLGEQVTYGTVIIGTEGAAVGAQVLGNKDGVSVSKGMIGVGGSPEGCAAGIEGVQCTTVYYWCRRQ